MTDLKLVPIPTGMLVGTAAIWQPFVEAIAKRSRCHPAQFIEMVNSGEVHVHLAWDTTAQQAMALAGTRILIRGDERVGELIWCTGSGRTHWLPLIADLERYHREHLHCAGMKAACRPGWKRALEQRGYRVTHLMMDKEFNGQSDPKNH